MSTICGRLNHMWPAQSYVAGSTMALGKTNHLLKFGLPDNLLGLLIPSNQSKLFTFWHFLVSHCTIRDHVSVCT